MNVRGCLRLEDRRAQDPATAGRKAATLAALRCAGLPVPDGMVIPTTAVADLAHRGDAGAIELADHLLAGLPCATAWAVRSSATDEDTATSSAAGRYRTRLEVRPTREALASAIRDVAASATGAPLAILAQPMLRPRAAGVAFGADPVTGETGRVVIDVVAGTADRLVDGRDAGVRWTVTDSGDTTASGVSPALDAADARAIHSVVTELGNWLGAPQDVEWAIDVDGFHLLQSRPITALPSRPHTDLPPGTWVFDRHRYPDGMTPFGLSIAAPAVGDGLTAAFDRCGALIARVEMRGVAGYPYLCFTPAGARPPIVDGGVRANRAGSSPPAWALGLASRLVPDLRARCRRARDLLASGDLESDIDRWNSEQRRHFREAVAALRQVDPAALSDDAVRDHLQTCVALLRDGLGLHFRLMPAHVVGVYRLVDACARLLDWEQPMALRLLARASAASDEPTRELRRIARRIVTEGRKSQVWSAVSTADPIDALRRIVPDGVAAFDAWCETYGLRTVDDDPGSVTLTEVPGFLQHLLVSHVRRDAAEPDGDETAGPGGDETAGPDDDDAAAAPAGGAALEAARALLAARPRRLAYFTTVLAAATRAYAVREDNVLWALSAPSGLVRRALVEIGVRLHRAGMIGDPRDIALLDVDTVVAAAAGEAEPDHIRTAVAVARSERAWVAGHPLPDHLGPAPTAPPDLRFLPRAARTVNAALLLDSPATNRSVASANPRPGRPRALLTGIPGSVGRYTGPVRIVRGPGDFASVRSGDVLVCPITDPAWSVLFGVVGALVTDGGGALCHAAIIAREHGIPAVLATERASDSLANGQLVTVDGAAGIVTRADRLDRDSTGTTGATVRAVNADAPTAPSFRSTRSNP